MPRKVIRSVACRITAKHIRAKRNRRLIDCDLTAWIVNKLNAAIVDQFAEDKENVSYEVTEKDRAIEVTVSLSPADMGKVIGRQGKIAKALRTIVRAATPADSKRYVIEIREKGGDRVDGDDGE